MQPPSKFQTVDTLKLAKRKFRFTSNKLDYLTKRLVGDKKVDTGGFELWYDIIVKHCPKAFDKMVEYCEHDTWLLEAVYNEFKAWDDRHPALANHTELDVKSCNSCGSTNVKKDGWYWVKVNKMQKYKCKDCGHNMRSRYGEKRTKEQNRNLLRSH